MGTINYSTSDYITMGLRPYDYKEADPLFMAIMKHEAAENGETVENYIDEYYSQCYTDDYNNIAAELEKYRFWYFHIAIKPGYYEGFSLDISYNFPVAFDNWEERREAQKEVTEIKRFLTDCAGLGLVECSPGWCTRYGDYKSTIAAIKKAVAAMREEIRVTPTWAQYNRQGA